MSINTAVAHFKTVSHTTCKPTWIKALTFIDPSKTPYKVVRLSPGLIQCNWQFMVFVTSSVTYFCKN